MGNDISYLMDRKTINIAGSSIGFSKILVLPAYDALVQVIPDAEICLDNLQNNIQRWEELKDTFEKKMKNGENYIEESRGKIVKRENSFLPTVSRRSIVNNQNDPLMNTGTHLLGKK